MRVHQLPFRLGEGDIAHGRPDYADPGAVRGETEGCVYRGLAAGGVEDGPEARASRCRGACPFGEVGVPGVEADVGSHA